MNVIENFFSKIKRILLVVSGDKMRFACVANEHVGVFDADKIG